MVKKNELRNKKQNVKTAQGRRISSTNWIKRHINDPYVQLAKANGYRSRAAFKLLDILKKFPHLKRCKNVLDLGCAPGGWMQVLIKEMPHAKIVGVDIKHVEPLEGAVIVQGDFLDRSTFDIIECAIHDRQVDLIVSDMAANASGDSYIDHVRNVELVTMAIEFAHQHLSEGGAFICKVLQGKDQEELLKKIKILFAKVRHFKPY